MTKSREIQGRKAEPPAPGRVIPRGPLDIVLKIGGALLRDPAAFSTTTRDLGQLAGAARVLVVPGGGPFADAVRELDRRLPITEESAHWMATLAMDQYAHVIAAHVPRSAIVEDGREASLAAARGLLPVLAPYRWLRQADPLPHSWDVTSDSIAGWVAATSGARHLVLLKPIAGPVAELTDAYFTRAIAHATPPGPTVHICTADAVLTTIAALF